MKSLSIAMGTILMGVPMGMHGVILAQNTRKRATDSRCLENGLQFGDARQDIVPQIPLFRRKFLRLAIDSFMETARQIGSDSEMPIHNKFPYLRISQFMAFL
jgi:hypothetical protein